jgi:hypothetical protein
VEADEPKTRKLGINDHPIKFVLTVGLNQHGSCLSVDKRQLLFPSNRQDHQAGFYYRVAGPFNLNRVLKPSCNLFHCYAQEIHGRRHIQRHRPGTRSRPVVELSIDYAQIRHSADAKRMGSFTAHRAFDNPWQEDSFAVRTIIPCSHDAA